jgi:transcriptional regulator with XRE-family HTH domain
MPSDARDSWDLKQIGDNLRRRRRALELSQEAVAFRAGFTNQSGVSKLERGERESGITKYVRAARALEMPLGDLFDGIEQDS